MEYSIGIDLGGTNTAAAVVNSSGKIVCRAGFKTGLPKPSSLLVGDIYKLIDGMVKKFNVSFERIKSVGIGAPGLINSKTRVVEYSCNFNYYFEPIAKMLEQKVKRPVFIENDANVAAVGEYYYLKSRGEIVNSLVALTLGTGIGGGIIFDGKIFHGCNFSGGEIGHMVIKKNGRLCNCGRRGCFETYASATGLVKTTREVMEKNPNSKMWQIFKARNRVSGKTAFDAIKFGDYAARKVIDIFVSDLAAGVVNIINILQPEVLVVGGGISKEGDRIIKPLQKIVNREEYAKNSKNRCKVLCSILSNDAGLIGAAMLG